MGPTGVSAFRPVRKEDSENGTYRGSTLRPAFTETRDILEIPDFQEVQAFRRIQDYREIPDFPEIQDFPEIPDFQEIPPARPPEHLTPSVVPVGFLTWL